MTCLERAFVSNVNLEQLVANPVLTLTACCNSVSPRCRYGRIELPVEERKEGKYRVTVTDLVTGILHFTADHSSYDDAMLLLVYKVYMKINHVTLKLPATLPRDATEAQRFLFPMLNRQMAHMRNNLRDLLEHILLRGADERNPKNRLQECLQDYTNAKGRTPEYQSDATNRITVHTVVIPLEDGTEIVGKGVSEMAAAANALCKAFVSQNFIVSAESAGSRAAPAAAVAAAHAAPFLPRARRMREDDDDEPFDRQAAHIRTHLPRTDILDPFSGFW